MKIDIPDFQLEALSLEWDRYLSLIEEEEKTGKASYEIFSYEDAYGSYWWLIGHIVKQYKKEKDASSSR